MPLEAACEGRGSNNNKYYIRIITYIYIYMYIYIYIYIYIHIIIITIVYNTPIYHIGGNDCGSLRSRTRHPRLSIRASLILYYTILYYTMLYCAMLYYTMLYYTILYSGRTRASPHDSKVGGESQKDVFPNALPSEPSSKNSPAPSLRFWPISQS